MEHKLVKFKDSSSDLSTQVKQTNEGLECMSHLISMFNNTNVNSNTSYYPQYLTNHNTINNIQYNIINNNHNIKKTNKLIHSLNNIKNINVKNRQNNNSLNKKNNSNNNKIIKSGNTTTNNNVKYKENLHNICYHNELTKTIHKIMAYQLVTDFYNNNKYLQCSKCKLTTSHRIKLCNCSDKSLCKKCFLTIFSNLKTEKGKSNYNNSKNYNNVCYKKYVDTLQKEIKCNKCKSGSQFMNYYHKMNNDITNNTMESKDFYKWKKLSDMEYFSKDIWCLDKTDYPIHSDNKKCKTYSFSIFYHPKKDNFTISINLCLLKLYNVTSKVNSITLYYPYQNYMFVNTAYHALSKLMEKYKCKCLEENCINGLINNWNNYCYLFNNILKTFKNCGENYKCNQELEKIHI